MSARNANVEVVEGLRRAEIKLNQPDSSAFRQRVLILLSVYRLIVSLALMSGSVWLFDEFLEQTNIQITAIAYVIYACTFLLLHKRISTGSVSRYFLFDLVFILAMMLLLIAERNALSVLLTVFVLAYAALAGPKNAIAMAAAASLMILGVQANEFISGHATVYGFLVPGGLGLVYFIAATIFSHLARQAQENRQLAEKLGIDLRNMAELNGYIIQRMDSGVIVIDGKNNIQLTNDAAWYLLGMQSRSAIVSLDNMSAPLHHRLQEWRATSTTDERSVSITGASDVMPRFIPLGQTRREGVLILLEDASLLNQQAQQLKHSALGRLTASIAHEIRNPLGAISHAAQLLVESSALDTADRRLAEIIHQNAGRTNNVIENVMQLTRKEKAHPERIPLKTWLHDFVAEFARAQQLENGQLQIDVSPDDLVLAFDAGHLHQILANLCQNAMAHGVAHAQRKIIQIKAGKFPGGGVVLDIIDFGPGIDPETAHKIFEPFFTTASRGTGLGLFIAKELTAANQAKLDYVPVPSGGSCFRITHKGEQ